PVMADVDIATGSTICSRREGAMSFSPVLLDATGRRRSPAAMPGHSARAAAAEQGSEVSGGPADGRGDRRGHAQDPGRPAWAAVARDDRGRSEEHTSEL